MYEPTGQEIASHQKGRYKTRKQQLWTTKNEKRERIKYVLLDLEKYSGTITQYKAKYNLVTYTRAVQ